MRVLVLVLMLLLFGSQLRAQSAMSSDSSERSTRLERIGYVVGGSLAFSLADYIGFNLVRGENNRVPFWYHALQGAVQAGFSYLLYTKFGLPSTIAFNLIWWTWGDDLGYFGWGYLINPHCITGVAWENRTVNPLLSPAEISWASWTPVGLLRPAGSVIPRNVLFAQAAIGLSVSVAMLW